MTALLLDIEGTTTSISFVYDILFPYAQQAIPAFLSTHATRADVVEIMKTIAEDALEEERTHDPVATALTVVKRQMANDIKATGLKQLQGLVWQFGYEQGSIHGHVYGDVPLAFKKWTDDKRPISIYSSGSRLAQQLLFRHSVAGDLTPQITGYYDTTTGPKREANSYKAISTAWGIAAKDITFCTDQPAEADAALAAGLQTIIIMRPGNAPLPANLAHPIHADLIRI